MFIELTDMDGLQFIQKVKKIKRIDKLFNGNSRIVLYKNDYIDVQESYGKVLDILNSCKVKVIYKEIL